MCAAPIGAPRGRWPVQLASTLRVRGSVGDGDAHVAHQAIPSAALDGRAAEPRPERGLVQVRELGELRCGEVGARLQRDVRCRYGELVPGTGGETVVAAVDAVAERAGDLRRDRALVLDREIGDAAAQLDAVR